MQITPYLMFDGQCEAAFAFYARLLGGEVTELSRFGDMPGNGELPDDARGRVLHARLQVRGQTFMGSDHPPEGGERPAGFALALGIDDLDDARRVFDALAEGGVVRMPFAPTFFAAGFGMCTDRFGTPWMVNCDAPAEAAP